MHLQEATDRYLTWLIEIRDPSPHTVRAYTGDLRQWIDHVGGQRPLCDLPTSCVHSFVLSQREAGLSRRTISRRVAAVRGLHGWLVTNELTRPPSWDLSGLHQGRSRALPRVAAPSNIERLHRSLRSSVEAASTCPDAATTLLAVSFMLATGARVAETCALSVSNIDLGSGVVRLLGKGMRDRTVYVTNSWLLQLLRSYSAVRIERGVAHDQLLFNRANVPLSTASVRLRMARASQEAGLTANVTPHMLRHAAATRLLESGVDIRIVQRLLGHASITTTEIYTHVTDLTLRQALSNADVLGGVMNSR